MGVVKLRVTVVALGVAIVLLAAILASTADAQNITYLDGNQSVTLVGNVSLVGDVTEDLNALVETALIFGIILAIAAIGLSAESPLMLIVGAGAVVISSPYLAALPYNLGGIAYMIGFTCFAMALFHFFKKQGRL